MKHILVLSLLFAGTAHAAERWITFKTGHNSRGAVLHQIDRTTIRQEGPYRIFWTRVWSEGDRQPLTFTVNEKIFFLSEKFVVDCKGGRFGTLPVDSARFSDPPASLSHMAWQPLASMRAVNQTVCGGQ